MKYMIDLNEDSLFCVFNNKTMPIPIWYLSLNYLGNFDVNLYLKALEYLLKRAITSRPLCPTIGGLFHEVEVEEGEFVLSKLVDKFGSDQVWDCIERALTSINVKDQQGQMILHRTIECAPQFVSQILMRFPDLVYDRDKNNRLPIHYALENGMEWNNNLVTMIHANHLHLKDCDPVTKLPLLALAAKETSCDLRTIYYLLRKNPECVNSAIEKHTRKRQSQDCDNGDNQTQKRRRGLS